MSEFRVGHMLVESPWGNAGGVVKNVEDVEVMAKTGVGWIEAGSYTLDKRYGNDRDPQTGEYIIDPNINKSIRVYYHNVETGESVNSLGMPNKGMDVVETEIPEMLRIAESHGKELVVNIAPITGDAVGESQELLERVFEAGAENVLLNAGCPNVVTEDGGRHEMLSYQPEALGLVLGGLKEICEKYDRKVSVRLSPYPSRERTAEVLSKIHESSVVSTIFTPNTWPGHVLLNREGEPVLGVPGGGGGLSGPAKTQQAQEQVHWAVNLQKWRANPIDVVSSSSITTGVELAKRMKLGAVAGAGTTFFYESGDWQEDTDRLLRDFAEAA